MHRAQYFRSVLLLAVFGCAPFFSPAQQYPAPYRDGQLWGYANPETGQIIVPPTLDSVSFFSSYDAAFPIAWVKKDGRYGLYNLAGELVLPIVEPAPLPIARITGGFFSVERLAFGASNAQEESDADFSAQGFALRPIAYFDENGRLIGKPFEFLVFHKYFYEEEGGYWNDPNDFDSGMGHHNNFDSTYYQVIWKAGQIGLLDLKARKVIVQPQWSSISVQGKIAIAQRWEAQILEPANKYKTLLIDLSDGTKTVLPDSFAIIITQGVGDLILARNTTTKRLGFLDKKGKIVIPFQFKKANPFSKNGFTKVLSMEDVWSVIDKSGQFVARLGKYNGFKTLSDGSIWIQSDEDALYRKKSDLAIDSCWQIGVDFPPEQHTSNTQFFWLARRLGKMGLLDVKGKIILPFEFDDINFEGYSNGMMLDSVYRKRFFSVAKNGRRWLFNTQTVQPLFPKSLPGNGLEFGETFDKSNFELLQFIAVDSLAVIRLADNSADILNVLTGKRWGIKNANSFYISPQSDSKELLLFYNPIRSENVTRVFRLNGQVVQSNTPTHFITQSDFGNWSWEFDQTTGLTAIADSVGRILCHIHSPFSGEPNRISIEENEGGDLMPYVVIVHSEKGESAVFSLDGRLLSPPYIWKAEVSHDLIFATMYEKRGVYRLSDGHEILPCAYHWIKWVSGKLSVAAPDRMNYLFSVQGKLLATYPKGLYGTGPFSNGLQVVYREGYSTYVNEKLEIVFQSDSIIQARSFSEGLGAVQVATLGWKYITPTGKQAFNGFFQYAESFQDGRAIVRTKDGWTKLIDNQGNAIMQVRSNTTALSRFRQKYLLQEDSLGKRLLSLDGAPVLNNFVYCNAYALNEPILFFGEDKWGVILSDGTLKWIDMADFTIEKNWTSNGDKYMLKGFGCQVVGVRNAITGAWIVALQLNQSIYYDDGYKPFGVINQSDSQDVTLINRNTGEVIRLEPGSLQKIGDQAGWLLVNDLSQTAVFYSPDLKTKTPWNYHYRNIQWNEVLNLYQVNDEANNLIGYISKNGHVLFEN